MLSTQGQAAQKMPMPGANNSPNTIYVVFKPQSLTYPNNMDYRMRIDIQGISAYLPVYFDYMEAMNDYPYEQIHEINLVNFKRELELPI
tara:strand:- start:1548 stop:1814 length:267 start_codon:yes stop_codon:yes gene_type:complete